MLIAYVFRLLLIVNGGQLYFSDESRYRKRSVPIADLIIQGDWTTALRATIRYSEHPGIAAAMLPPALFHRLAYEVGGHPQTWAEYWQNQTGDFRVSALIFAIPSVLCIAMIYLIALQACADKAEALLSALFFGASNSFFIYSKHFLPYDGSMLIALTALFASLRLRHAGLGGALMVGALLFCSFWVWNGQIFFLITIALLYCVLLGRKRQDLILRPMAMAAGALLLFIPICLANFFVLQIDVLARLYSFAGTVTQGDYAEGIIFPFLYFEATEGATALVWAAGILLAIRHLRAQQTEEDHRLRLWFFALIFLYLLMALLSSGLHLFVLYGRTARILVPFVAMICGFSFARWLKGGDYRALSLLVTVIGLFAIANFLPAIEQQYYREFTRRVQQEYESVSFSNTFSPPARITGWFRNPARADARYQLVNAGYYYPIGKLTEPPVGEAILKVAHPFMYKPWQFVGLSPEMRDIINRDGLYMWVIDTGEAAED